MSILKIQNKLAVVICIPNSTESGRDINQSDKGISGKPGRQKPLMYKLIQEKCTTPLPPPHPTPKKKIK